MDDITQRQHYAPSRTASGGGWIIIAVIVALVLFITAILSLGDSSGTVAPADPAATGTTPDSGLVTEPAAPAAPAD